MTDLFEADPFRWVRFLLLAVLKLNACAMPQFVPNGGMQDAEPIIYRFRSYKPMYNALTAAFFGVLCLWMVTDNTAFWGGWIALVVCVAYGLFEVWEFSRNSCELQISPNGIREIVGGNVALHVPWEQFGLAESFDKKATVRIRLLLDDGTIAPPEEAGWVKKDLLPNNKDAETYNKYLLGKYGQDQKELAREISDYANRMISA